MFRLLGLLGGLAAVTDIGVGAASDESLRRCLVATRLARAAGCSVDEIRDVVYISLLEQIGCTAYSQEAAVVWGDDIASTRLAFLMDFNDPRDLVRVWVPGLAAATGRSKPRVLSTTLRSMRAFDANGPVATCDVAREASSRLGLPEAVRSGLVHSLCMWNGKGYPRHSGEEIPLGVRLMHVASVAVLSLYPHRCRRGRRGRTARLCVDAGAGPRVTVPAVALTRPGTSVSTGPSCSR